MISGASSSRILGSRDKAARSPLSAFFRNWATTTRFPRPADLIAKPMAAVVFPFPSPQ